MHRVYTVERGTESGRRRSIRWLSMAGAIGLALAGMAGAAYAHGGDESLLHICKKTEGSTIKIVGASDECNSKFTAKHYVPAEPDAASLLVCDKIGGSNIKIKDPAKGCGSNYTATYYREAGTATSSAEAGQTPFPGDPAPLPSEEGRSPCPPDSVLVGPTCVDRYEASVWFVYGPDSESTIEEIRSGNLTSIDQLNNMRSNVDCSVTGNGCTNFYALSVERAFPRVNVSWFQAAAACRNSGKRLLTNQEWQMAALGTPDPGNDYRFGDCNVGLDITNNRSLTGSAFNCVSETGAHDMVGNVSEWVADWMQGPSGTGVATWDPTAVYESSDTFGNDGVGGINEAYPPEDAFPAALTRGGSSKITPSHSGVFAMDANLSPSYRGIHIGFRCGRPAK